VEAVAVIVRITQLDGSLPNIALMRLAAWHRAQGDDVRWERGTLRRLDEPEYGAVYGSAIFTTSAKAVAQLRSQFPGAVIGGWGGDQSLRVESVVPSQFTGMDYSGYPEFTASIGYAMRGCRFKCGFCMVPKMEGKARESAVIGTIWRGEPHPKHIHLLDNDFFGSPAWRERVDEIVSGGYRVCINQGINVRLLTDENAAAVVAMAPWETHFKRRRLYTAWDNIGDERVFFDGIDRLERAGWKANWIMAYMLVGDDPRETFDRIEYRFGRMTARGVEPYPMVHDRFRLSKPEHWHKLKRWQRYVRTGKWRTMPFEAYSTQRIRPPLPQLFEVAE
jgi:hypothetical protein